MELRQSELKGDTDASANWASFCDGNQAAFLFLYETYFSLLFTWGCKWVKDDPERVKDVLHDFFIYLWDKKANLSRQVEVRTYLLTAFKRRLFAPTGEAAKHQADATSLLWELPDATPETADAAAFADNFEKVKAAMSLLSPAQREVIELRYLHNMSIAEIAAHKQTSHRTVYNLVHRALVTLRTEARKKNFVWLW